MLLAACTSVTAAAPSSPSSPASAVNAADLASKTVALVVRNDDGDVRAYCSGVWIAPKLILTANHCTHDLEMNERLEYVVRDDVYAPGEVRERETINSHGAMLTTRDEGHDLALLYAPAAPDHGIAPISAAPILPGMPVQAMGHPLGLFWSYSRGDVAAVREAESHGAKMLFVQTTTPISPGSSGGALFDAMGQVVGICHGTFVRGQNLNLFIHWQYIGALLQVQGKF